MFFIITFLQTFLILSSIYLLQSSTIKIFHEQTPLPTATASMKNYNAIKNKYIYSNYDKFYIGTEIKPASALSTSLTTTAAPNISEKERAIYYQFLTQRVRAFLDTFVL